jgi:hypothetical protein
VKPEEQVRLLQSAAARATTRPEFLGWIFARYEELEKLGSDVLN